MTLDNTATFDAGTNGATWTNSESLVVNGTAPIFSTAAAKHGALGIRWAAGTAGRLMYDYGSNQTARTIVADFYFRVNTWPTSAILYLAACDSLQTGGTVQGDIRINSSTRTVTIRNGTTASSNSPTTEVISLSQWYRACWSITDSTNTQNLKIFVDESATPFIDITSTSWTLAANRVFYIGPYIAAAGASIDFDTMRFSNTNEGPFAPVVTTTHYRKISGLWVPQNVSIT